MVRTALILMAFYFLIFTINTKGQWVDPHSLGGGSVQTFAVSGSNIFAAHYICDGWGFFPPYIVNVLHPTPVDETITNSIKNGVTLDMVFSKNIPSNLQLRGECLD